MCNSHQSFDIKKKHVHSTLYFLSFPFPHFGVDGDKILHRMNTKNETKRN